MLRQNIINQAAFLCAICNHNIPVGPLSDDRVEIALERFYNASEALHGLMESVTDAERLEILVNHWWPKKAGR